MADKQTTVSIIFQGIDEVTKTTKAIESNVSAFAGTLESATAPLADIAEKALLAEAALAALVTGGIIYATSEAGKFGDSFNEISTLIDASAKEITGFKQEILDYGRDSKSSYETINGAVYSAISAGIDYKQSLDSLNQAEKLAIAGKADLNSSLVLTAGTLNAYGESTDQASHYSDVFFQTVKLGQTTLPELAASLSQVTGIAASGGVPIETLAAAIAAVTASGVPTSQAMTSLKAAISNIIKPSAEARSVAQELGIEFNATALKSKGFEGILQDVYQATGGNVDQMAKLFGSTEALNSVLILAEDKSGKFENALHAMAEASGSVEAAYNKMANNMQLINQNLINNIQATVIEFGSNFLDEWNGIAEGGSEIFKGISFAMDQGAFDPVIRFIEQAGKDLEGYLKKVAAALPEALENVDYEGLLESIRSLGGSARNLFESFFGDIDLTTPEGLSKALQKIIDTGKSLTNVVKGIMDGLNPFIEGLGKLVDGATDADGSTQELTGKILGFATGVNNLVSALNYVGPVLAVFAGSNILSGIANVGSLTKSILGFGKEVITQAPLVMAGANNMTGAMANLGKLGGAVLAYEVGHFVGTMINEYVPGVKEGTQAIFEMTDKVLNFTGTQGKSNEMLAESRKRVEEAKVKWAEYKQGLDTTGQSVTDLAGKLDQPHSFEVEANENLTWLQKELQKTGVLIEELPDSKTVTLNAETSGVKKAATETLSWFDELGKQHSIEVDVEPKTEAAEKTIKALTGEKELELKLKGEIDERLKTIETDAAKVQTAMEWNAKLDIAEIEAGAKKIEALMGTASSVIESTGTTMTGLFDQLGNEDMGSTRSQIERQIREESDMRKEAHEKTMKLMDEQIRKEKMLNDKRAKGEATFTVAAEGLAPALESIWFEVMKAIQIRGVEDGGEFLNGI